MALAFNCPSCGEVIVVKYLRPGETAACRKCGAGAVVPADAREIDDEPAYSNPEAGENEGRALARAEAAASLPSEEQAAQDALAAFYIGLGGFLGGLPLLMLLWVFVAPYGIKLALRGRESENRTFANIGLVLCILGLVLFGVGLIAGFITGFIYSMLRTTYRPGL